MKETKIKVPKRLRCHSHQRPGGVTERPDEPVRGR